MYMKGEVEGWAERLIIPRGDFSVCGEMFQHSKEMIVESKRLKGVTEADFADGLFSIESGHESMKGSDLHFWGYGKTWSWIRAIPRH